MASPDPPPQVGENPPLPWRARLLLRGVTVLHAAALRRDGTVNRLLLSLFDRTVPPNATPVDGVASSDHAVSDHLRVRLFTPKDGEKEKELPMVVYFHGGGFAFHSASSSRFDALCRRLASAVPATVASVDYRLAPEHRFPAPYDDGEAALRWVLAGSILRSPPTAVFVAGDSAGGNVAHHVAARALGAVAGVVAIQPFFGGEVPTDSELRLRGAPFGAPERVAWLWRAFLPPGATRDHDASNVPAAIARRGGAGGMRTWPPTMVSAGGWDPHQDRQWAYADALRGAGARVEVREYPDAVHAFYLFEELQDSKRLLVHVAEFVNRRTEDLKKERAEDGAAASHQMPV
ncbi:hypothetical protein PR202_ga29243 [Eleusine coracana subsp. coracana]|uniref:Alpha/beta hydrolase fold-3 domain-containing protein n=1 Tax=Eleusine coracana subsp. coracana TaxID=191504 RepID=A0AAV5DLD2_ELECO|nr:hypothetical protein QOZ80_7AG0576430 [Eleusine coracana subsp. coracana]GJN11078.1 hypothetical protein PR202_ga29243 [Eleusine coracana subsp. coracana]